MKTQNQEGITLVALIITIIVMMILVGIIVGTVIKNGLFNTTQGVAKEMQESKDNELDFSTGDILICGIFRNWRKNNNIYIRWSKI